MAEALLRAKADEFFDVYSAGTHPESIDTRTLTTLTDFGLPTQLFRGSFVRTCKKRRKIQSSLIHV